MDMGPPPAWCLVIRPCHRPVASARRTPPVNLFAPAAH